MTYIYYKDILKETVYYFSFGGISSYKLVLKTKVSIIESREKSLIC